MKIIIAGAGEVGSHLAKMLSSESHDVIVIDPDEMRLSALSEKVDVMVLHGNTASVKMLKDAGVDKADLFIAVNPSTSQNVNIVSAILAKKLGCKKVTARINSEEYLSPANRMLFTSMGIDYLFYPESIASTEIIRQLQCGRTEESIDFARGKMQLSMFRLDDESPLVDTCLLDFSHMFHDKSQDFRVVAVSRNGQTIIPKPDFRFKPRDMVYIIAIKEGMDMIRDFLSFEELTYEKVMIAGGGKIAQMVASQLSGTVSEVKLIEPDKERCLYLSDMLDSNVTIVNGDGRNSELLREENVADYDVFVSVSDSSENNILSCVAAKKMGVDRTIAEVENLQYILLAENMGVDAIINKKLITAGKIFKLTLSNKVKFVKYMNGTDAEILEFVVDGNSKACRGSLQLKDINFPAGAVVGGIIRGGEPRIAVGSTSFEPMDRVIVFALPGVIKDVEKFFK